MRNPLTSITGAAYHLKTRLGPKLGTREKGVLAIIEKSIRYPDKMVDHLEYSRELRLELVEARRPVNHKRRLSSYDGSTRNTHSGFNWERTEDTGRRGEDAASILNLVQNASDAMPEGGTLTIASQKSNDNLQISFVEWRRA